MPIHHNDDADETVPPTTRQRVMRPARPSATPPQPRRDDADDGTVTVKTGGVTAVMQLEQVVRNLIVDGAEESVITAAFARVEAAREAAEQADIKRANLAGLRASVERERQVEANTAAVRAGAEAEATLRSGALAPVLVLRAAGITVTVHPEASDEAVARRTCTHLFGQATTIVEIAWAAHVGLVRHATRHGAAPPELNVARLVATLRDVLRVPLAMGVAAVTVEGARDG